MQIRAVDVGYGNTKFVKGRKSGEEIRCGHFPSVATIAATSDMGGGATQRRDVVKIPVGGMEYQIGRDAVFGLRHDTGRILTPDYPETDRYLALLRGALAHMEEKRIDILVTGLPVTYYAKSRVKLEEKLVGEHDCGDSGNIEVQEAWIIPQPLGGFLNHALGKGIYKDLRETNVLCIDVGFFTLDWIVCRGLKVVDERSGSTPGGMSQVLGLLAKAISAEKNEPFDDINELDRALRNGCKMPWFGDTYDFNHLLNKIGAAIEPPCSTLLGSVGKVHDLNTIIVVGGGASFYLETIRKLFKHNNIILAQDSMYANVRGFFLAGEQRARRNG